MQHEMKLHPVPFEEIKAGLKTIEIRLNDEERQKVKVGDSILFKKRPDLIESFEVKVLKINKYSTYRELVEKTDLVSFGQRFSSKEQILERGFKYYSKEEVAKYGWIVFKIKVIKE